MAIASSSDNKRILRDGDRSGNECLFKVGDCVQVTDVTGLLAGWKEGEEFEITEANHYTDGNIYFGVDFSRPGVREENLEQARQIQIFGGRRAAKYDMTREFQAFLWSEDKKRDGVYVNKFKIGDEVRIKRDSEYAYQCDKKGKIYRTSSGGWWGVTFENEYTNSYPEEALISVKKQKTKKEEKKNVNKHILEMYPKTKDAVLVDHYFGEEIEDLEAVMLKGKETDLFDRAKLKEAEEKKAKAEKK